MQRKRPLLVILGAVLLLSAAVGGYVLLRSRTSGTSNTTAAGVLRLGTVAEVDYDDVPAGEQKVRVTVYEYRIPFAATGPQPTSPGMAAQYVWSAADTQVCNTGKSTSRISRDSWTAQYEDSTRLEPSNATYGSFSETTFPLSAPTLEPGECVRGWVTFESTLERPVTVAFKSLSGKVRARWLVGSPEDLQNTDD